MSKKIIPFGSLVRDAVTGFEGLVIYRVEHMNGCVRYGVQPVMKNGQLPESKALDGPNLKVIAPPRADLPPAVKTPNAFNLGVKVKDRLTGFVGVAVLRFKHMYSGNRYGVQPPIDEKGDIPDIKTFDEYDLQQVDPPVTPKEDESKRQKTPAGPHDPNVVMAR